MYRRREIAIDLTALLDVILIILFMFVVRSTNQVVATSADSSDKENDSQIVQLQKENKELKEKITTNSVLNDTCLVVTLTIDENSNSVDDKKEKRIIRLTSNIDETKEEVSYDSDELTYAKNKLNDTLKKYFKDLKDTNQMTLLVFQYDETKIYNKDYKMIDSVLKNNQEELDNIYLAYYDTSAEKNND